MTCPAGSSRTVPRPAPVAHDLGAVLGVARVVLLAVAQPGLGFAGMIDSGLRPVDAGLERALRRDDLAVLVLLRRLAEVPDVPARSCAYQSSVTSNGGAVLGDDVVHHPVR